MIKLTNPLTDLANDKNSFLFLKLSLKCDAQYFDLSLNVEFIAKVFQTHSSQLHCEQ
jgi:hypothetical protein